MGTDISMGIGHFWEGSDAINKNKDFMKNRFWWKGI